MTSLLEQLRELGEKATPGPWQEDGTLWSDGKRVETDASANDGEDWITFKSRRAEEDRALFIALREALPAVVELVEAAQAVSEEYWFKIRSEGQAHALSCALAPFLGGEARQ